MKKLAFILFIVLVFSCKKEISYETPCKYYTLTLNQKDTWIVPDNGQILVTITGCTRVDCIINNHINTFTCYQMTGGTTYSVERDDKIQWTSSCLDRALTLIFKTVCPN